MDIEDINVYKKKCQNVCLPFTQSQAIELNSRCVR